MRVWYSSDTHLGHRKLALTHRGFATVEEHDETIVSNWNRLVRPGDTVWMLGDITLSTGGLATVDRLNGRKHLITGNHDAVFPGHRDAHKHQPKWREHFDSIQPFARRKAAGYEFMLSHFPYAGDHTLEQRYTQYRLRNEGMHLVHGHTHSDLVLHPDYPRQVHVGLDAHALMPVSQEELVEYLRLA